MRADDRLDPTLDFLLVLWALDHRLHSESKRMIAQHGVSGLQRLIIRVVGRVANVSTSSLARLLRVEPSTLNGALDRLITSGSVVRRSDPLEARRAQLLLGQRGRELDAIEEGTIEAKIARVLERTPEHRVTAAMEILSAIVAELDDA